MSATHDLPASAPTATPTLVLGVAGYTFLDLFDPERLADLYADFDATFQKADPLAWGQFDAYRQCRGTGMSPQAVSDVLVAAAPHVSAFVAQLFGVKEELAAIRARVKGDDPVWQFKHAFAKKRVLKAQAGTAWTERGRSIDEAAQVARVVLDTWSDVQVGADAELSVALAVMALVEIEEVARKVVKGGGAVWTDVLFERACLLRTRLDADDHTRALLSSMPTSMGSFASSDPEVHGNLAAFVLDAFEAWLSTRLAHVHDPARRWSSLRAPKSLDYEHLVELRRPDPAIPELFVGHEHEQRQRDGFNLTDRRMTAREVAQEIDYCLLCHDRDKDSCSKGLREPKTHQIKRNPLGVLLDGCPLEEKISEMHQLRRDGDPLAALTVVTVDNPMCPGTGHRICNDCMKACVFQKQEPVNIPQVETRVLTEILELPWGLEIYGLLTRWNPLNVARPTSLPYNGKNVLVVGLGPAGYTLAHYLAREGFGVVAVDGLKLEPLPTESLGPHHNPTPVHDFHALYSELDERLLLGFGGVSEYGITVRWDKNFLTVLYVTLARNRSLRMFGGVRFGGTMTLDDAWASGFDHVAISAGAGRPTVIPMENNLARGVRAASDFLMGLQLTGAYKKSSIANLQVSLPAIVVGGGLTAIDTATELLAYYLVQIEKEAHRYDSLVDSKGADAVRALFDAEEWDVLSQHLAHARELADERARSLAEGREARVQDLLAKWGGVTLVYRKNLKDSPAYRLNHEEVTKSLEEGVRYIENMSPIGAAMDVHGQVRAMTFARADGSTIELPAKTVCVAAGTNPNVTYEREYEGTFAFDSKKHYFQAHRAVVDANGETRLEPVTNPRDGFFTSYLKGNKTVSFYGDNHPYYAGSVVKAMASAKDGHPYVAALFPETEALRAEDQPARNAKISAFLDHMEDELAATLVAVNRLTPTIVEVVVRAPMAARRFQPGQFYRMQNFESYARLVDGTRLAMEGLALTGAWVDAEKGLLGTMVLEMGGSSRLCAALVPGERVVLMGPTGAPTEIMSNESVVLCGGGLGNAVLFSIARAFKAAHSKVIYFAGYRRGEDLFKREEIERFTDQVIWTTDSGSPIEPNRPQDAHFRGNIVEAMAAYDEGKLGTPLVHFNDVDRILAIGSDRMMNAVREARHTRFARRLNPKHRAIGSINSPMQCMMKEVCAQCLQKHRDPQTGIESVVFSCFNQDQDLDHVDFPHLGQRLRANSMQEKISNAWLEQLLESHPDLLHV